MLINDNRSSWKEFGDKIISNSNFNSCDSIHTLKMTQEPRIQFKALKGFPPAEDDKIETEVFLNAAKEIVVVIESFGKLFTPVISDMNGNITKLTTSYEKDKQKFHYVEDLIILNINVNNNFAPNAMLWLKRGLQLICTFFENIYAEQQNKEHLKKHLQDAYEKTLKPYHGFIVQSTIKIIYNWVPTRTQLIGQGDAHDENIMALQTFLPKMSSHLNRIDSLLKKYNMDDPSKA